MKRVTEDEINRWFAESWGYLPDDTIIKRRAEKSLGKLKVILGFQTAHKDPSPVMRPEYHDDE